MSWGAAGIGAGIGALLGGPVGAGIGAAIGGMLGNDEEENSEYSSKSYDAEIKVMKTTVTDEGIKYPIFRIRLDGTVEVPHENFDVKIVTAISDITHDEIFFYYDEYTEKIPYQFTEYDNSEVDKILIDALNFPRKGNRKLSFLFAFFDKNDDNKEYFSSIKETYYDNTEDGYLDIQDKRPKIEEVAIKMAFIMSSIDGNIDVVEGKEIGRIGKLLLEDYPDDEKDKAKKRINHYISSNYSKANLGELHIDAAINEINSLSDSKILKHEIFEYCLKVAAADGVADKNEVDLAYYMAEKFGLEKDEYMKQLEKILPVTMQDKTVLKNRFEKTLGIEPDMSKTEITNILKKEFKKWNQRVAHQDPAKREQAELMLLKISELRKKYK